METELDIVIALLAGLVLLFIGVRLVAGNVERLGSRRFRAGIGRAVEVPVIIAGLGIALGALMLSVGAVTSVCITAVGGGLVKARSIVPLLTWANIGTSALVILAARDVHLMVVVLLAAVGLLYYFGLDQRARLGHLTAALLGGGLLFYGVSLVQGTAVTASTLPNIVAIEAFLQGGATLLFVALAFVLGVVIDGIAGSPAAATVVVMALAQAGLVSLDQGIALVLGIGAGSAVALWQSARRLEGTPRQLLTLQALTALLGAVVMVPLFAIELRTNVPLARALAESISDNIGTRLASIFVIYQLVAVGLISLFRAPVQQLVERWYPETPDESLSKPRYIYAAGDIAPETGALLVEREQQRLIGLARDGLESVREEQPPEPLPKPLVLREAIRSVSREIAAFLRELVDASPPRETAVRLGELGMAQGLLDDLSAEIFGLIAHLGGRAASEGIDGSIASMIESLHLVLTMLIDELQAPDEFQYTSLLAMTAERSNLVDKLRRDLTHGSQPLTKVEQESLLTVTTGYERIMGLVQRYLTVVRGAAPPLAPLSLD